MNRSKIASCVVSLFAMAPMFAGCSDNNSASATYNHDMSKYKAIAEEALKLAKEDKLAEAFPKTKDLEKAYDDGTKDLDKADPKLWKEIDDQMDEAMKATNPTMNGTKEKSVAELQKFIDLLGKVPPK